MINYLLYSIKQQPKQHPFHSEGIKTNKVVRNLKIAWFVVKCPIACTLTGAIKQ